MKMQPKIRVMSLWRLASLLLLCALFVLPASFISGCAGSGGGVTAEALANYFSGPYFRGAFSGSVLVRQSESGELTIVVNEEDGQYIGSAIPSKAPGDFTATLARSGVTPLSVVGSVAESSVSGTVTGTVKGMAVNNAFTANKVASNVSGNPFAGSYAGTYAGDASGTFTMTVSSSGSISVQVIVDGNTVNGSGQLTSLGGSTFSAAGTGTVDYYSAAFAGYFQFLGINKRAHGTWTAEGGFSGTWHCSASP